MSEEPSVEVPDEILLAQGRERLLLLLAGSADRFASPREWITFLKTTLAAWDRAHEAAVREALTDWWVG